MAARAKGLRERRESIVFEHVDTENRHDAEATIATFDRSRYDVAPILRRLGALPEPAAAE
jgi:hypothetical protein